jgi:hypothetical protein
LTTKKSTASRKNSVTALNGKRVLNKIAKVERERESTKTRAMIPPNLEIQLSHESCSSLTAARVSSKSSWTCSARAHARERLLPSGSQNERRARTRARAMIDPIEESDRVGSIFHFAPSPPNPVSFKSSTHAHARDRSFDPRSRKERPIFARDAPRILPTRSFVESLHGVSGKKRQKVHSFAVAAAAAAIAATYSEQPAATS